MTLFGSEGEVKLMVLDPRHFHAALIQKTMYDQVSPIVYVFTPAEPDLDDYLKRIKRFNTRAENPTHWKEKVYTGPDYLEKMLEEKPGNVMITAGNNKKNAEYIKATVDAGINVLCDKPMCIDQEGWQLLKTTFESAEKTNVLLSDIMTARYEITNILQKMLANNPEVFGNLQKGTPTNPSVIKESVHHLFKYVTGDPIKRPARFFDVTQQGEGIVDVVTHLVDLVMWECFPEQIIDYTTDIELLSAKHWPTMVTREQFEQVTGLPDFPDYLRDKLDENGVLPYYGNGEIIYKLKGVHVRVSVRWDFEAPTGTGDTYCSIMKGSKANFSIGRGEIQNYQLAIYVLVAVGINYKIQDHVITKAIADLQSSYPGVKRELEDHNWHVLIPEQYRVGHEAHFGQVTEMYLRFLTDGELPDWEVPNTIAKYYTTTKALELARQ